MFNTSFAFTLHTYLHMQYQWDTNGTPANQIIQRISLRKTSQLTRTDNLASKDFQRLSAPVLLVSLQPALQSFPCN